MKKILLSLFVGLIGLINFGYCDEININMWKDKSAGRTVERDYSQYDIVCVYDMIRINNNVDPNGQYKIGNGEYSKVCHWDGNSLDLISNNCCKQSGVLSLSSNTNNTDFYVVGYNYFTENQCQIEYNLIPISSVDQNYCINNGLCPSETGTGDYTGDLQYSNIYINNILHPGRQNIFINIPDYITWDYSQNEVDFNVYVGSGYDVDYINSIVDINSYRPTSEDFTNVFVSGLTLVFPYIFIALLILFIWKLVKRIFK